VFRGRTVDYSKPLAKVIAVRDAELARRGIEAKNASSDFVRGNYQRIAEWYLTLAEGEFKQPEKPKEVSVYDRTGTCA
jgi:hypothetical protein